MNASSCAWSRGLYMTWRFFRPPLLAYLVVLLMLSWFERWMVYPAPKTIESEWVVDDLPHEDVTFDAGDGVRLHGWYVPHPAPRGVLLFCHGNGENVARVAPALKIIHERVGAAVFAWDYRGYGRSQGRPFETNTIADARLAQLWLAKRAGVRPEDVVVVGRSLGGGVAIGLASRYPVRGLVLDRTFASLTETAAHHYPWLPVRWIMKNRYASIERIRDYHGPLLQTHGTDDEVVPFDMGRRLFEAAPGADKQFIPIEGGTHNSATPEESWNALVEFLDRLPPMEQAAVNGNGKSAPQFSGSAGTSTAP